MIYRSIDDTYKKLSIIFIAVSIILLITCIILFKLNLGYKNIISQSQTAMQEVASQTSQMQTTFSEVSTNFDKVAAELEATKLQLANKEAEISLLKESNDNYIKQITILQTALVGGNIPEDLPEESTTQTTQKTSSALSVPSLNISPDGSTTNTGEMTSGMNVVTID